MSKTHKPDPRKGVFLYKQQTNTSYSQTNTFVLFVLGLVLRQVNTKKSGLALRSWLPLRMTCCSTNSFRPTRLCGSWWEHACVGLEVILDNRCPFINCLFYAGQPQQLKQPLTESRSFTRSGFFSAHGYDNDLILSPDFMSSVAFSGTHFLLERK